MVKLAVLKLVLMIVAPALGLAVPAAGSAAPALPAPVHCPGCWRPGVRVTWDWVLDRVPKPPYRRVAMYDIDGFQATAQDVASMHAAGIKVVCYLSAGAWERFRPDAKTFPDSVIGRSNGWAGERWLDIREIQKRDSVLRKILGKRLDMCRAKGFDAVEFDNVDGYTNRTGFKLTARDQLYFNATLANEAHRRGLSALQKNDLEQIPLLLRYFDGAINEQCNEFSECTTRQNGSYGLDLYVSAGKPVFNAEYRLPTSRFCAADRRNRFNGVRFNLALDGSRFQPCG